MISINIANRQVIRIGAVVALVVATVVPALVMAAQVTERSIALSNSSAAATNVTYQANFTSVGSAGAFVIDFCSDSPVIGETCTAPTGFDAAAAASTTVGFTDVSALDANTIVVAGTIGASTAITVDVTGITNPTSAGPLYARIITYDTDVNADAYTSTNLGTGNVDDGGLAISITSSVGVSGAVLESLTFCVSGVAPTTNCGGTTAPVLKLGETVGDIVALSADAVSEGSIYTQISTNAENGAVVRLKSSATDCGGLKRAGSPAACDILPALTGGIAIGEAKFGVKTATATNTGTNPNGTFQPVTGSGYNNTTYALNYISGNATGVTSNFGDPFLDTDNAPVNNKNMALTFGVSVTNSTPAGLYSADLSMIAVGKY